MRINIRRRIYGFSLIIPCTHFTSLMPPLSTIPMKCITFVNVNIFIRFDSHRKSKLQKFHSEMPMQFWNRRVSSRSGVRGQVLKMNFNVPGGKQTLHHGGPSCCLWSMVCLQGNRQECKRCARWPPGEGHRPLNQLQRRRHCLHFQNGIEQEGGGRGDARGGLWDWETVQPWCSKPRPAWICRVWILKQRL